jgi:hypothetical protein
VGVRGGKIPPPMVKALSGAAPILFVTPKRPRGGGVREPVELARPRVGDPMLPMLPMKLNQSVNRDAADNNNNPANPDPI